MSSKLRKRLSNTIVVLLILAFLVFLIDQSIVIAWAGSADLEITFVVTDASTSKSIEDATVVLEPDREGRRWKAEDNQRFTLKTDHQGIAKQLFHNLPTAGKAGHFGLLDTWSMNLPDRPFWASAKGYNQVKIESLGLLEYRKQVQEPEPYPEPAKLVISIAMIPETP